MDFNQKFSSYVSRFENNLNNLIKSLDTSAPSVIKETIEYAISNGGKRIRPVLLYATCEILGVNLDDVDNFALAIELIHSYSLVHDDLPCMDDDDYRRGKLSTHKKFGEAFGVLCGDALLNLAYEICLNKETFTLKDKKAMKILADFAGYNGMIAGQVLDILAESEDNACEQKLLDIYVNKTSKLLTAPMLMASALAGDKYYKELSKLGTFIGITFQVVDDIMDVEGSLDSIGKTPGKDQAENKLTSIKIWGLDGAKKYAKKLYEDSIEILSNIPNSVFLRELVTKLYNRKK